MAKFVYTFEEGNKEMKSLLGGKGANLAEMKKIGLPVPDGFTISTEACMAYHENNELNSEVTEQMKTAVLELERKTGKQLGNPSNPLLVSVRSGAAISMPGMMDTVLNLGLNEETVEGLADLCYPVFAYDAYRRFIQMFSDVVLGIEKYKFDKIYNAYKEKDIEALHEIISAYKKLVLKETRRPFPEDVHEQLSMAVEAVFKSWNNHRAIVYRNVHHIDHNMGTAVNVQSMVFGNYGETSGTGVAFTRNPSTGEKVLYGEYLLNAQGEDVVAGIRTPEAISTLETSMPQVFDQFVQVTQLLEKHYKDVQDIEFTIEREKLYLLQTRTGKRTAKAAVKIAVDFVEEGIIDIDTALMRIQPEQVDQLLHPTFDPKALENAEFLTKGLPASPGAASGRVYFDSESIKACEEKSILVRTETSPEDIEGMISAEGILTSRGGMTSHAAVVARGMGKCCVAGCPEVVVESHLKQFVIYDTVIKEGDYISLDGSTGKVYKGIIDKTDATFSEDFAKLLKWADERRTLSVRTNADTEHDAEIAVGFGAEGIGLCRTEHMFFEKSRIINMRQLILSDTLEERLQALDQLQPYQEEDFYKLFKVMGDKPVTVRLLDPPLHEFLPKAKDEIEEVAKVLGKSASLITKTIEQIQEVNPMLGHRGCRLGITYPEIYQMQVKAIMKAACRVKSEGSVVHPEIMIPLVGFKKELKILKELAKKTAEEVLAKEGIQLAYSIGTMIEVPRAALTADEIATEAEFFSFGTNDLTQMTLGFSRDDSGKFIGEYRDRSIFTRDPFERIDENGVGKLMGIARDLAKSVKEDIKMGICGEHGGEPNSIAFCHKIGLDYVSCSPYRVPIAKLSAAQAAIIHKD